MFETQSRMAGELEHMRVIYVRGLLRMPFREMRGYLHDMSSHLSHRTILSISYFGPITSFICIIEFTAAILSELLTSAGGRIDPHFRPWLPLCRDLQDDDAAKQFAVDTFCRRIAGEIISSPNLVLATFLERNMAPQFASTISTLVRGLMPRSSHPIPHTSLFVPSSREPGRSPPISSCDIPLATNPSPAAPAVSTSALASSGVVAEGTV